MQKGKRKPSPLINLDIQVAVFFGFILALVMLYLLQRKSKPRSKEKNSLAPSLDRPESGVVKIETFSHYVARQLGFKDESECPELMKLAYEYLKTSKECDDKMYEYLGKAANAEQLYEKLVDEFERCILGYFAFHWSQVPLVITQVLSLSSDQKKLKETDFKLSERRHSTCHTMVKRILGPTFLPWANPGSKSSTSEILSTRADTARKQSFKKISENLKLTRISTQVEEMNIIGTTSNKELNQSEVMVPVAPSERSPVLFLVGGGMGVGNSIIVLKDIMKESFWSGAVANAVKVDADAFKEMGAIYTALSTKGHHQGMLQTAELVQQLFIDASKLLVNTLNKGRDVIMYGTLSWIPFVEQTICMTRNVHKCQYRMGEGYQVSEDGTVTGNYWEQIKGEEGEAAKNREPYRIVLVGFVCDAYLDVVRGIRSAIQMGSVVKVKSLLKSHKKFASAFPRYYQLVDNVRLYCTNAPRDPPKVIAQKNGDNELLVIPDEMNRFDSISDLNGDAETIYKLYKESDYITQSGSVWKDIVLLPDRASLQLELKTAIQGIEVHSS